MESTYALVMKAKFGWGARETGTMFAFIGVAIVITQGGLIGRFVERWGERVTLIIGLVALAIALVTIGFAHSVALVAVGSVGIALGNGLVGPNVSALVSRFSSAEEQGESLGVNASAASLGRILGPIAAGPALQFLPHEAAPMAIGAAVVVLVALPAAAAVPPRGRD
jgi:MFS family permease